MCAGPSGLAAGRQAAAGSRRRRSQSSESRLIRVRPVSMLASRLAAPAGQRPPPTTDSLPTGGAPAAWVPCPTTSRPPLSQQPHTHVCALPREVAESRAPGGRGARTVQPDLLLDGEQRLQGRVGGGGGVQVQQGQRGGHTHPVVCTTAPARGGVGRRLRARGQPRRYADQRARQRGLGSRGRTAGGAAGAGACGATSGKNSAGMAQGTWPPLPPPRRAPTRAQRGAHRPQPAVLAQGQLQRV